MCLGTCPTNDISIEFKIYWNFCNSLLYSLFIRSQWSFAHLITVTLSWRVQNFVVIDWVHFKPEQCEFGSNFEFDRSTVSRTGARWKYDKELADCHDDDVTTTKHFCPSMKRIHRWPMYSWDVGHFPHYRDVIMSVMASQITGISNVYSTVCSGGDQRKHQSSALLAFVRGIHRWPVNSSHKGPVMLKMFPFDDVIMTRSDLHCQYNSFRNLEELCQNWTNK